MKLTLTTLPQFPGQPEGLPPFEVRLLASAGPQGPAWDVSVITDGNGELEPIAIKSMLRALSDAIRS